MKELIQEILDNPKLSDKQKIKCINRLYKNKKDIQLNHVDKKYITYNKFECTQIKK